MASQLHTARELLIIRFLYAMNMFLISTCTGDIRSFLFLKGIVGFAVVVVLQALCVFYLLSTHYTFDYQVPSFILPVNT